MKYGKTALMVALLALGTTTGAQAEESDASSLNISGSTTMVWEKVTGTAAESNTTEKTFNLNITNKLSDKIDLYLRYSYRGFGGDDDTERISEIDLYGVKYQLGENNTMTLGVQEASLGVLSGLVDLSEVGKDNMLHGVTWDVGAEDSDTSYRLIGGRVDSVLLGEDNSLAGIQLNKKLGDVTVSGEYLYLSDYPGGTSFYGAGAKYNYEKWEFATEYLRSTLKEEKTGYLAGVTYAFSDNDSLGVTYRNLKANAVATGLATYDANTRGVEFAWEKALSDHWNLKLSHERATERDTNNKENTTSFEVTYSF